MPWVPELFSAPALARLEVERRREIGPTVPYYAGLLTGETEALIGSFSGEPLLHDPLRGRVKGERAFAAYTAEIKAWLDANNVAIDELGVIRTEPRGVGEYVLHFGDGDGRVNLPTAIAADRSGGKIDELRVYYSLWPLNGRHAHRPPLLQPDPGLRVPDILAEYQRALAAGDAAVIVEMFEPDAYVREPAGGEYIHRGRDGVAGFYEWQFSNGGGIPLEHCAITDDGRACVLEYNVVRWGGTELPPQAGIAIYVRGESRKLAAARIYDDVDPPLRESMAPQPSKR